MITEKERKQFASRYDEQVQELIQLMNKISKLDLDVDALARVLLKFDTC